ncbi:MAG: class I SAM-dependent methyltransferase [Nitrospirae bacterium]|nr:class I SAM-dependent methyltransferase [Nitrospirota bacterium]
MEKEFLKYEKYGAYHWDRVSGSFKHHDAGLLGKYLKTLELTDNINPKILLDIGCGDGCLTAMFAEKFPNSQIIGLDYSEAALKLAIKKTENLKNIHFIKGSCYDLGFKNKVDTISCVEVIEHLDRPKSFLMNCHNLLVNNGYLICTTPVSNPQIAKDPYHTIEYSQEEFKQLLTESGFTILKHQFSHPLPLLKRYKKVLSPMGIGHIRLFRYLYNFNSIVLKKNPFLRSSHANHSDFCKQYVLARKQCS